MTAFFQSLSVDDENEAFWKRTVAITSTNSNKGEGVISEFAKKSSFSDFEVNLSCQHFPESPTILILRRLLEAPNYELFPSRPSLV